MNCSGRAQFPHLYTKPIYKPSVPGPSQKPERGGAGPGFGCGLGCCWRTSLRRRRSASVRKPRLDGPLVFWHRLVTENAHCRRVGVQHVEACRYAIAKEQRGPGPDAKAALAERRADHSHCDGHLAEMVRPAARWEPTGGLPWPNSVAAESGAGNCLDLME